MSGGQGGEPSTGRCDADLSQVRPSRAHLEENGLVHDVTSVDMQFSLFLIFFFFFLF